MANEPDQPTPPQDHHENVANQADLTKAQQRTRQQEMRQDMMRSVITEPLLSRVLQDESGERRFEVIISLNEYYIGGMAVAQVAAQRPLLDWEAEFRTVSHYIFVCLTSAHILELAQLTVEQQRQHRNSNPIYRIWEDSEISVTLTKSLVTVKADAAQRAFQAHGEGIVWAVLDSGVKGDHPHFKTDKCPFGPIDSLKISDPLEHMDFTPDNSGALLDRLGHGTHVAGIIAGYWASDDPNGAPVTGTEMRDPANEKKAITQRETLRVISGVAPKCKLVSMKVIADVDVAGDNKQTAGQGKVSWVLLAIDQIQEWNQNGKRLLVHGVNMSLGYDFNPRWFACGHSPICVEINRLVKSGVVVVVSAGNAGYSTVITQSGAAQAQFNDLTITDPGNAELAITVGSTHREMPHTYGVSYFSSRGPTGDGRAKPDLLAPGERIISCAAGKEAERYAVEGAGPVLYCEQTGTSMAAPHVSGAVAAFLSVRQEFVGQPEEVKDVFMANTVDLKRDRYFQGAGLLDLMKVLQAV